jgi:hypothetical protein
MARHGAHLRRRDCSAAAWVEAARVSPLDVALAVARALESIGVGYFLGGSMASSFQGQPRLTHDPDFVVDLRLEHVAAFVRALGPDFEIDEAALSEAIRTRRSWNIFHVPTVTRVDLFVLKTGAYDAEEFSRRRGWEIAPGQSIVLKAPEDSILRKLLWFRAGGENSDHQLRDVIEVLRAQRGLLDEVYLATWSKRLQLDDLLDRARAALG